MALHDLRERFQAAFTAKKSTGTSLLKAKGNILDADRQKVSHSSTPLLYGVPQGSVKGLSFYHL